MKKGSKWLSEPLRGRVHRHVASPRLRKPPRCIQNRFLVMRGRSTVGNPQVCLLQIHRCHILKERGPHLNYMTNPQIQIN